MTKKVRVTKRSIVASFLALAVCVSMLVGTSYAWFTDSVTSSGNIIKSGKLDIEMSWKDGKEDPEETDGWQDASTGAIFKDDVLWEPGFVQVRHINIRNVGNLALHYKFAIVPNGELKRNDNGKTLAEAIDVYYFDPAQKIADRTDIADLEPIGTLSQVLDNIAGAENTAEGNLLPKEEGKDQDTVTIVLKMREGVGNEYQDMTLGTDFSIQVLATQFTYEKDTFDDQYDKDADGTPDNEEWPYEKVGTATAADAAQNLDVAAGNITVTVPAAALAEGDKFELLVGNMEQDTVNGTTTMNFDLKLRRNGALVEEKDGIEYTVSMQVGNGLNIISLKHNGEDVAGYTYNAETGILTFTVSHFSPFTLTYGKMQAFVENEEAAAEIINTINNGNYAVAKDSEDKEPAVVGLASGTYKEPIVIKQYPQTDLANPAQSLTDPAESNIIEFVGTGNTVIEGDVAVYGSFNGQSSNTGDFKGDGKIIFKNLVFDNAEELTAVEETDGDAVQIALLNGVKTVVFEDCTFKNATHITIGNGGKGHSGYITFKGCTFENAACISGYCYNLLIEDCQGNVDSGHGKGFVNIQSSGKVTVKDCNINLGKGAYAFRTTNNMSAVIEVINSTFTADEDSTAPIAVLRGTNGRLSFTNCDLFTKNVDFKNSATVDQISFVYPQD